MVMGGEGGGGGVWKATAKSYIAIQVFVNKAGHSERMMSEAQGFGSLRLRPGWEIDKSWVGYKQGLASKRNMPGF